VPFFHGSLPLAKLYFDPELLPVDALAGEAPLASERLSAAWLRQRFLQPAIWQPEPMDEYARDEGRSATAASVLVPIVLREEGLTMMLTRRTAHLTDHGGQISFPGGRVEPEDESGIITALRETEEEVGLARRHVEVLGVLPEYVTGTGYRIMPVVGLLQPPFELQADPDEVDEIFEVPLAFLMNGVNHERRSVDFPAGKGRRSFYSMPYERHFIWGATAGMLRNLFHFLRAE
jgi:8-oxo-dGTP pyrophosphatase MutT (NUDIX family)